MKFEGSSAISKGLGNALEIISEVGSLPLIRGTWFYVDPEKGSDGADGRSISTAVQTIRAAYGKCTTSVGDGIALLAYPSATTADTAASSRLATRFGSNVVLGPDTSTRPGRRGRGHRPTHRAWPA
jgi:hypothetical protein